MNSVEVKENVHMRAVIIAHASLPRLADKGTFASYRLRSLARDDELNASYGTIAVTSQIEPPTEAIRKVVKSSSKGYEYRIHLADIRFGQKWGILVAAPLKDLIPPTLPNNAQLTYLTCDLKRVFNDQFRGGSTPSVSVARLNARVLREDAIESVALYGKDLLTSNMMKDILGEELVKDSGGPFSPVEKELRIAPNSCRLVWDDGTARSFGLNLDSHGNYSFYMRDTNDVPGLLKILKYVNSIGAMSKMEMNPLRKSTTALDRVSH